jgi:hypothetical protein
LKILKSKIDKDTIYSDEDNKRDLSGSSEEPIKNIEPKGEKNKTKTKYIKNKKPTNKKNATNKSKIIEESIK